MDKTDVITALATLAHPVRLDVFRALVQAGPAGLTPTALAEVVDATLKQSTLATHLKDLAQAGLVAGERDGRHVIYRADYTRMNAVLAYLMDNCCRAAPAPVPAPARPARGNAGRCGC